MKSKYASLFTSESVSAGHPDKIADQISDAILDAYLAQDPNAKVACECLITTGCFVLAGEIASTAKVDAEAIARQVIADIGYTDASIGFDAASARCVNLLHTQSPEINQSVADGGAGDQGLMFGYACNETPELMPLAIHLSHRLMQKHNELLHSVQIPWLLPDAKAQVTVAYNLDGTVESVRKVVLSTQHRPGIDHATLSRTVIEQIIRPVLGEWIIEEEPEYLINPSGSFTIGGPHGDTGLTGRKIVVDSYGGSAPHGGGAYSGKDPSKVDRSAAYMARYIARHLVLAGVNRDCMVQLSYAIGRSEPVSVAVRSLTGGYMNQSNLSNEDLSQIVQQCFDLTPVGIINTLQLKRPIYRATAAFGHMGRAEFPWEQTDEALVQQLKDAIRNRYEAIERDKNAALERRKGEFAAMSKEELVAAFNRGEGSGAWIPLRMRAMRLLVEEMQRRALDLSEICHFDSESGHLASIQLKGEARLEGNKVAQVRKE